MTQENFESLSKMMYDKGVRSEAFELLANLRHESLAAEAALKTLKSNTDNVSKIDYAAETLGRALNG